jgi:hypothetical protein
MHMAENDDRPQPDKFRDMARELECDEDEAAFEEKVRKVATTPKASQSSASEEFEA